MFGKTAQTPESLPRQERSEQSFLQTGVRMKGEIEVDGDLRIEGSVEGTLLTRGVLMLGPKATVQGDLRGREVVVHGKVAGTIRADERIHLARGAKIKGDIFCRSLVVEEGVHFEGRSHMGEGNQKADQGEGRPVVEPQARAVNYAPAEPEGQSRMAAGGSPKRQPGPPR